MQALRLAAYDGDEAEVGRLVAAGWPLNEQLQGDVWVDGGQVQINSCTPLMTRWWHS